MRNFLFAHVSSRKQAWSLPQRDTWSNRILHKSSGHSSRFMTACRFEPSSRCEVVHLTFHLPMHAAGSQLACLRARNLDIQVTTSWALRVAPLADKDALSVATETMSCMTDPILQDTAQRLVHKLGRKDCRLISFATHTWASTNATPQWAALLI